MELIDARGCYLECSSQGRRKDSFEATQILGPTLIRWRILGASSLYLIPRWYPRRPPVPPNCNARWSLSTYPSQPLPLSPPRRHGTPRQVSCNTYNRRKPQTTSSSKTTLLFTLPHKPSFAFTSFLPGPVLAVSLFKLRTRSPSC